MEQLDYIIILLYFLGLIAVSVVMSRKIKNSEDMFIAGRNSSWWLSGVSSYMTIFSASTFVVWGGKYENQYAAAMLGNMAQCKYAPLPLSLQLCFCLLLPARQWQCYIPFSLLPPLKSQFFHFLHL